MSIANGTTHYDYPQVQLTDRPCFADFNPAFADIDSKLYGLITGASTDHAAIGELQTGLGETNLLLASVKNTADSASGKADTNAENITLLQTALGNTDRNVANKLDSVAIAEPYDASAGTYSVGDIVVYNGQRYKCVTAVAVAEPFDADKWVGEDVQTVLDNIEQQISSSTSAADVTLAPITGMTADDVQEGIEELKSAVTVENVAYTLASTAEGYNQTQNTIKREGDKIIINLSLDLTNAQSTDHLVKFDKALAPSGRIDIPVLCGSAVDVFSINSDTNETFIKCNSNNQTYRATISAVYPIG